MDILLLHESAKRVTKINKRLNLWSLCITWGTQFLIAADLIIENDLPDPMPGSWIFLSNIDGLDCLSQPNVLPKVSKIIATSSKLVKMKNQSQFQRQNDYQF